MYFSVLCRVSEGVWRPIVDRNVNIDTVDIEKKPVLSGDWGNIKYRKTINTPESQYAIDVQINENKSDDVQLIHLQLGFESFSLDVKQDAATAF